MAHDHGNPNDITIKSNHNVSDIEKIEKYNEIVLERLKQNIKDVLKQYPPTSNNMLAYSVISSMKDSAVCLESEMPFLKSEIKEKKQIDFLPNFTKFNRMYPQATFFSNN